MATLNYTILGTGSPVVFLHGFLEDHTMWNGLLDSFPNNQVICIDLPGHGKSEIEEGESMESMATKVAELLTSLNIENPSVVGHSMGGYVGLELINQISLNKLVLFYSNFWEDTPEKKHNRTRVIRVLEFNKEIFIREAIPNLFNPDTISEYGDEIQDLINSAISIDKEKIIEATKALRDRKDHANTMEKFHDKIAMIHGEKDPIILNDELNNNLNRINQSVEVIRMFNCGHMGHIEAKKEAIAHLKSFISI